MKYVKPIACFIFMLAVVSAYAQHIDLSKAVIWVSSDKKIPLDKPVQVLREEIEKRTQLLLPVVTKQPDEGQPVIYVLTDDRDAKLPKTVRAVLGTIAAPGNEGFRLAVMKEQNAVIITAKDARSVLYGVGRLLRKADMRPGTLLIPENLVLSTAPRYPIRGHQLGYRPKTNSYDAFSVKQFDQYIRDLVLFGANSIEIMPPRTDDDDSSVHMQLPSAKMMVEQSKIARSYNLDVWMWYPNMGPDYTNRDSLKKEMQERIEVFAALPKLDHVFVPGGDPGDLEPEVLFNWLGKVAVALQQFHPNAKIWVSPQVFRPSQKWFDDFFRHVNSGYPWLGGVVFGPWVKIPLPELRQLVNDNIPIRRYPDITHSLSCQYPVLDWDVAYAMTLGRECVNPRPEDEKHIHNLLASYASGSISYSEGTNDDVNKFIWSDQDWDPQKPVIETLRDYSRLFMDADITEAAAQGIMNLETNLRGALLTNEKVEQTLRQWQQIESKATPELVKNFRFQMCLLRAYYDAYIQRRLIYEKALEEQAKETLESATAETSSLAILQARMILEKAVEEPVAKAWKERCMVLADSLFSSIGAQLTIEKHGAMPGRGNFIDNIDIPLNDAPWLLDQLAVLEKIEDDTERLNKISEMLRRTDPGPGGFYDHFGSVQSKYRIVADKTREQDPGSLQSPRISFGVGIIGEEWVHEVRSQGFSGQTTPGAWMSQINTLYDTPLKIRYDNLDTTAAYKMRMTYTGRFRSKQKLVANGNIVIHDFIQTGEKPVYEFDIPKAVTAGGQVTFTWTCGEGQRGSQVTEVWLMRK
ncbi:hypothetical protein [Agriterribacter sp.]|mgnify:CR=1 FL=1|uniref:hypothetical protein n=1 Tax=Agriterribacter sp. TaxID=2821509 RepID=UPI002B7F2CDA|nr:hypothetical protein [Agriterribacter sp.]HRO46148.1 hypothetical protein [Agriterribacter sp.]HRQ16262.1 hypothetical protein [Agriterribacter sp.]